MKEAAAAAAGYNSPHPTPLPRGPARAGETVKHRRLAAGAAGAGAAAPGLRRKRGGRRSPRPGGPHTSPLQKATEMTACSGTEGLSHWRIYLPVTVRGICWDVLDILVANL